MKHILIIDSNGKTGKPPTFSSGLIAQFLATPAGKAKLANSMIAPLVRNRGYADLARKCFQVQQLPPGALPTYDRDIDIGGIVTAPEAKIVSFKHDFLKIGSDGKLDKGGRGRRVFVPKFEIYRNPSIKIDDIKRRKFNLIDRVPKKATPVFKHDKLIINSGGKLQHSRRGLLSSVAQQARQQIMAQEDAAIFKALDDVVYGNKKE